MVVICAICGYEEHEEKCIPYETDYNVDDDKKEVKSWICSECINPKREALSKHLEVDYGELEESNYDESCIEYGRQEFLVLTDEEADERALSQLTDDPYMWKMAVADDHTTDSLEDWADQVLSIDGRGSVLSSWDGGEDWIKLGEIDYYIFRRN